MSERISALQLNLETKEQSKVEKTLLSETQFITSRSLSSTNRTNSKCVIAIVSLLRCVDYIFYGENLTSKTASATTKRRKIDIKPLDTIKEIIYQ